ncbi:ECF transporter S component [Blautia sp. HCP3S3_G3]|uniref:ECF transporter S component n=1 Tax=Blautia sp. HCP3S3_G3 TaxID=3438913 RepID=UPI003F88B54C
MSEQVLRNGNVMERSRTRTIAQIAMLGAVAGVLMNLEFPLPFLAPSFYQLDFSEIPALLAAFAMGPVAGILTELVKILVHLVTKGTMTAGVGDVANFIFGCAYVVPAGLIYRFRHVKSRKHAVLGMAAGTVLTTMAACFMNAFVLLPAYGKAFGMPVEAFIEMGAAVHSSVNNLLGFVVMIIVPFNLFKYTLVSIIVFFIYKRIRVVLKGD